MRRPLVLRAYDIDAIYRVMRRLNWLAGHFNGAWLSKEFRKEGVKYTGAAATVTISVVDENGDHIDVAAELIRLVNALDVAAHPGSMQEEECQAERPRHVHTPKKRTRS